MHSPAIMSFIQTVGYYSAIDKHNQDNLKEYQESSVLRLIVQTFSTTPIYLFKDTLKTFEDLILAAQPSEKSTWMHQIISFILRSKNIVDYDQLRKEALGQWGQLISSNNRLAAVFDGNKPTLEDDWSLFLYVYVTNAEEIVLEEFSYGDRHNPVMGKIHLMPMVPPPLDTNAGKPK